MITLQNITKEYKMGDTILQVLKGIDLQIDEGDFVSIMGPSGSGKSTLMNIIGMLDIPSTGSYIFDDINLSGLSEDKLAPIRGKKIGFIFQSYNLIPRMSVIKQVMLPLAYAGMNKKERWEKAKKALERVGLGEKINHKPSELSGGQQQRVSIARALAINPSMLLADEPTGALDTKTGNEIMLLLQELNKEGKTIVLITHEPEIDNFAKKHIFIKDGLIQ
ncbi:MAG: ABC transporter ATP-binding protein [Candidatus Altimarinota bacterium]